jgi:hypothetical protein
MKSPIRLILLLALLAALGAAPPVAAEPSGFATFDWGTPRAVIEQAMKTQCEFSSTLATVKGRVAVVCSDYRQMSDLGLGPVDVKLDFINDGLQGYTVAVRRAQEAKLRAIAPQMLQPASPARAGARPSGMASHRLDTCLPGFFCLTVTTY